jgi:Protein of unknown function (DUF1549)/Protein of unknown function (DUF1553)
MSSSTWSVGARWRRFLPWAIGGLAFLGMALANAPQMPAQGKKADKAKAGKEAKAAKDKDKKEEKEVRPEPTIPKVLDIMAPTRGGVEQVAYINQEIAEAWKQNKVQPSKRCTDWEFIRRATLDIIGRIPTLPEIERYMKDDELKRRSLLIDRLLYDPQYKSGELYAQNFANLWTILLMTRTGSREVYREQMHDWLTRQFDPSGNDRSKDSPAAAADWSKIATELIGASGKTNNNGAVNFVLTHVGEVVKGNAGEGGTWDMVPVTSRTTRLFLGIRTQCVQCHDHPFNGEWNQEHFWGINAFFRQVKTPDGRPVMMAKKVKGKVGAMQYKVEDDKGFNVKGLIPYERRNAIVMYTDPKFLDGRSIPAESEKSRREELANFIVTWTDPTTKSPYFAKAFVNRMWGHLMGKSFTKDAVDDFGEHNPSSFPTILDDDGKVKHLGLLDKLAKDWAEKYHHDPKVLIRWICNSQAYGLSTITNKYNDKPDDEVFFARMLLKPMTPEQLFESLMTATESKIAKNKEELREKKKAWLDQLIVNFGNDEGEEASYSGTVVQALLLMNGQDINAEIMGREGTVSYAIAARGTSPDRVIDYLYKAALTRPPTKTELAHMLNPNMRNLRMGFPNTPDAWRGYYEDIFWALLNSNEFILNH